MIDIRLPLNVLSQSATAGAIAEISAAGPALQTVQVIGNSVATLLPGYPVKLVTGAGAVPKVEIAVPGTDVIYGLVVFNSKQSSWVKDEFLQVTTPKTVINMTASTTLNRGSRVGIHATTYKLIAATGDNYIGQLLDDATTDAVVRVELDIPLPYQTVSGS